MNMMPRPESRYDILFEPVRIGPVTTPNRVYQVPHVTAGVAPFGTGIFFWYSIGLPVLFGAYALWRRSRQRAAKAGKQFVAYPQTSPMIYEWTSQTEADADGGKSAP